MKKNFTFILLIILIGCQQDDFQDQVDTTILNKQSSLNVEIDDDILVFNSSNQFDEVFNYIISNPESSYQLWVNEIGFQSYYNKSEEVYDMIATSKYESIDGLVEQVNNYSRYLQLIEDGEGDLILETHLYNNPYKYILNDERIYRINDQVYKMLDDKLVCTNLNNIEELKSIETADMASEINSDKFIISELNFITKKRISECVKEDSDIGEHLDPKRRVQMYHHVYSIVERDSWGGAKTYAGYFASATAYKKVLVWVKYNTIFSMDIDADWTYTLSGSTINKTSDYYLPYDSNSEETKSVVWGHRYKLGDWVISTTTCFSAFDCWAYTRGTTYQDRAKLVYPD